MQAELDEIRFSVKTNMEQIAHLAKQVHNNHITLDQRVDHPRVLATRTPFSATGLLDGIEST